MGDAEEPLVQELPAGLQRGMATALPPDEEAFIMLAGAPGEGLVATARRVLILREQMPLVGTEARVDCFDYSYEQIRTVHVAETAGGGHLRLELVAPPSDDQHVGLYFSSSHLERFERAASCIRLVAQQTGGVPGEPAGAGAATRPGADCCCGGEAERDDAFCAGCGRPMAAFCGACSRRLAGTEGCCPACGLAALYARCPVCPACGAAVAPATRYCPGCGLSQYAACAVCAGPLPPEWAFCARCGTPASVSADERAAIPATVPERAAAHNETGLRLYQAHSLRDAARSLEAAVTLAPGDPLYMGNLAVVYAETGREADAERAFAAALSTEPPDAAVLLSYGYFHAQRGRVREARAAWSRVAARSLESAEGREAAANLEQLEGSG